MSLHDMYFSTKNKNYMYNILADLILKDTGIQIKENEEYINLYRLNYASIFENAITDELSEINKELINHIGNLILNKIKQTTYSNKNNSQPSIPKISLKEIPIKKDIYLYSTQRLIQSQNRYNFKINVNFSTFIPKKLILKKEQNSLFSNPNIHVLFNEKDSLLFTLQGSDILNNKEYITYSPLLSDKISCDKVLTINIRDYLMNNPSKKKDIYDILRIKYIHYSEKDYICIELKDNTMFQVGDEIGLFQKDAEKINIDHSLFIQEIVGRYILTKKDNIDLSKNYYLINMDSNITLNGEII